MPTKPSHDPPPSYSSSDKSLPYHFRLERYAYCAKAPGGATCLYDYIDGRDDAISLTSSAFWPQVRQHAWSRVALAWPDITAASKIEDYAFAINLRYLGPSGLEMVELFAEDDRPFWELLGREDVRVVKLHCHVAPKEGNARDEVGGGGKASGGSCGSRKLKRMHCVLQ